MSNEVTRRKVIQTAVLLLPGCGLRSPTTGEGFDAGLGPIDAGRAELDSGIEADAGRPGQVVPDAGEQDAGAPDAGVSDAGTDAGITPQCVETEDNILGPYYRADAPMRKTIASPSDGEWLIIEGIVSTRSGSACALLPGALVDIWHANADGAYDMTSNEFPWRGRQLTDAEHAEYRFETILPGKYLNGNQFRPTHIHFRVSAPSATMLTTQLYFEGDPYIPVDPFVRASLVKPLQKVNGVWRTRFDIVLAEV